MKTVHVSIALIFFMCITISLQAQSWSLTGNAGTGASNYIGTKDFSSLSIQVNKTSAGFITAPDNLGNTSFGYKSYVLGPLISRSQNTALGHKAMFNNSDGNSNVAVGYAALAYLTNDKLNVALGYGSLYNSYSSENTAIGYKALYSNRFAFDLRPMENVAVGYSALYKNTEGYLNVCFGSSALFNNTTTNAHTAIGKQAAYGHSSWHYSVGIGCKNLLLNNEGTNIAVGNNTLSTVDLGSINAALGYAADVYQPNSSGLTSIGNGAKAAGMENQAIFGNSSVTSIGGYVNWTTLSDSKIQKNIKANMPGLAFINKIEPITYTLDITGINKFLHKDAGKSIDENETISIAAKEREVHTGFAAQQVEKSAKEIGYSFSGVDAPDNENDFYGLRYGAFVAPLVKAVQELKTSNDFFINQNTLLIANTNALNEENAQQDVRINKLAALITQLQSERSSP